MLAVLPSCPCRESINDFGTNSSVPFLYTTLIGLAGFIGVPYTKRLIVAVVSVSPTIASSSPKSVLIKVLLPALTRPPTANTQGRWTVSFKLLISSNQLAACGNSRTISELRSKICRVLSSIGLFMIYTNNWLFHIAYRTFD